MRVNRWVATSLLALLVAACGQNADGPGPDGGEVTATQPVTLYTVNYPLAWAAQQLAGGGATVVFPAPADVDPAFWRPDLDTIAAYQQADRVLLNGANYAGWLDRVSLPHNRLLDTSRAFADQLIAVDSGPLHSHGPEGDHSHGALAFTVWLDLSLYAQQVEAIAAELSVLLPAQAEAIATRRDELTGTLLAMDAGLAQLGRQLNGAPLLYSHPVYQYLDRRYQLNGRSLHWEPDQSPSEAQWSELQGLLASHPARLMLWESAPLPQVAQRLEMLGIAVLVFRPQGNRPGAGDFMSNLRADIAGLGAASKR